MKRWSKDYLETDTGHPATSEVGKSFEMLLPVESTAFCVKLSVYCGHVQDKVQREHTHLSLIHI